MDPRKNINIAFGGYIVDDWFEYISGSCWSNEFVDDAFGYLID